jgi:hypothetical protein
METKLAVQGINLMGLDETFNAYGKVTVKNLRLTNFTEGIRTPQTITASSATASKA